MNQPITVVKNDHRGVEVWRYEGEILSRTPSQVILSAYFIHPTKEAIETEYVVFRRGDHMIETFYTDRWYNVFEIHDVEDDRLKGWYCNFTRPAQINETIIRADDLALDLFVYPDRRTLLLDQEEFDELPIADGERQAVLAAATKLQTLAASGGPPFIERP